MDTRDASSIAGIAPHSIISELNINPPNNDYDSIALP